MVVKREVALLLQMGHFIYVLFVKLIFEMLINAPAAAFIVSEGVDVLVKQLKFLRQKMYKFSHISYFSY